MSLSDTCLKQHEKENAIAKKWVLRGLIIATGAHLGLIPLMAFIPADVAKPPERIELVVTGPTDPIDPTEAALEEVPPEETVEALTEAVAQAELAAGSQISGGISAPPPLAAFQTPLDDSAALAEPSTESFEPAEPEVTEPEVVEEPKALEPEVSESTETADNPSEASSEAIEPDEIAADEGKPSETETADSDSEPVETAANNTADNNNSPDLDALRDRLARARARESNRAGAGSSRDADAESSEVGSSGTTPAASTNSGTGVARRDRPSEGSGTGSSSGNGGGDRSGATTVGCRQCDRPDYPKEALASGVEGSPSVSLEYDENGNVIGAVLEQSSGNAALDRAALEAARNYKLDSGGRSGSVSVEIDFGIEGSERSRAAQQRGERETVSNPVPTPAPEQEVVREPEPSAPEQEVVREPKPSAPEPAALPPATPPVDNTPASRPEETFGAPLPTDIEQPPDLEPVAPPPEPVAPPPLEPISPLPEPVALPPEPIEPPTEPSPIPDIMSPE
ncbi:MAG: hypothetical protein DCF25_09810 [Leptolyngbya foveolarum]|uniref:TonB C-terminal domain-containing protein n=1 Tax=Leptolyngbya foveolarum TaxID=47253 RepID=A0A2W4UN46_9CYAN|nr:MAG: hypothetical protein DCF25_09810 [Leptolyngbya foveolarum]